MRFNPPPNWPAPPPGWMPSPGWEPDPSWGPPPPGWQVWLDDSDPAPASRLRGAGRRRRDGKRVAWAAPLAATVAILLVAINFIWSRTRDHPEPWATTVAATIAVGQTPMSLALDERTGTLYVANTGEGTVSVVDTGSRKVTSTIDIGDVSTDILLDGSADTLYVAGQSAIAVVDLPARRITSRIPIYLPQQLALGRDVLYATGPHGLAIIDLRTEDVTTMNVGKGPQGIAAPQGEPTVYVANASNGTGRIVAAVDVTKNQVMQNFEAGTGAWGVGYASGTLCVTNIEDGTVTIFVSFRTDPMATVTVGQEPYAVVYNGFAEGWYVTNSKSGTVSLIDSTDITNIRVRTHVSVGEGPTDITRARDGTVFVANSKGNSVSVLES